MNIATFYSGSASSARHLIDTGFISKNEAVIAVTDNKEATGTKFFKDKKIETLELDFVERDKFFEEISNKIDKIEIDYIILSGFMKIIPNWFVNKWKNKILNVHPANLTLTKGKKRLLTGLNVVEKAIKLGHKEVKSTIHFVSEEVDAGPILVLSNGVKIPKELKKLEGNELTKEADKIQEKLKIKGDLPAFAKAITLLKTKKVKFIEDRLYIKENGKFTPGFFDISKNKVNKKKTFFSIL